MFASFPSALFTEEAENERMHLMVALEIKHPSTLFNTAIVGAQGRWRNLLKNPLLWNFYPEMGY